MNKSFLSYFLSYIFSSRNRQKLIFLAILGLFLSSFSLTVLQGIMGGLQSGLIGRSQNVLGHGYLDLQNIAIHDPKLIKLYEELKKKKINFYPELELEVMIQNKDYVSPIILHGIDYSFGTPSFLTAKNGIDTDVSDIVVGSDLARSLRANYGAKVKVTSPAHTDFLLEEIPRQASSYISDFYSSELPEIDAIHGWVRASFLMNLTREKSINKIRFYDDVEDEVNEILAGIPFDYAKFTTWESEHSTLVWALGLETKVMFFIFASMSVLIGICITSGFLIFFNKIKLDLASFWIMGMRRDKIFSLIYSLGQILAIGFCLLGVGFGIGFLILLDTNQIMIMPEQFVERNVPVEFDVMKILLAFFIPYIVASLFTHYTFRIFKKEQFSFLSQIRKLS